MKGKVAGVGLALAALVAFLFLHLQLEPRQAVSQPAPSTADPTAATSAPAQPPQTSVARNDGAGLKLRPVRDRLWQQPIPEPAFARFAEWAKRYLAAGNPTAQAALQEEGQTLARVRLQALADLIVNRPERALDLAVPGSVRQAMPDRVKAFLEASVNTRGDYESICVLAPPGHEPLRLVRAARIDGETHRVFTFGRGLDYVTRSNVPLNGIAVPATAATAAPADAAGLHSGWLLALDPNPARLLDAGESDPGEVGLEMGGQRYSFPTLAAASQWSAQAAAAIQLDVPTAESPYTEGRKRFLLMRVDFPDYRVEAMSTNAALTHLRDLSNFMAEVSYYKHIIAPVGQGSAVTPTMRMSHSSGYYIDAGLSRLYPEARQVARDTYGYSLSAYDFCLVVTGSKPACSYAGVGYIGAVGYHLANGYFDVRTSAHEFGHNLGLGHANWWDTGGRSSIGPGAIEEYGDPFDTMGGNGGGIRHYNAHFKSRLGWIPASDAPTVTSNGVYRLHAHDLSAVPTGLRCLRLNRASGDPYCLEFRRLWTDNKAMLNGISLRWGSGTTLLLDMTPGSANGKDDHPLTIGRTFSDSAENYHITPLRVAHTYPESIDVAINIGPFPGNQPPAVIASASTAQVNPGQTVAFGAEATDPDGDTLAYAWDFGDGDYSVDNSAATAHTFTSPGEYYVEVAVSDLKGGVARDSVVVVVGAPATYTISGRVLDAQNQPVPGMMIVAESGQYAFSQSDGSYLLDQLDAGSYTVQAVDPVDDATFFSHPFFDNPISVGPDFAPADFIATANSLDLYLPIVPLGSTWKYLDDGSDPGSDWMRPAFDDTGWSNGAAILGYGQGNETTVISYGPNANDKFITAYFRTSVLVTNLPAFANFRLEVLRDDGVIVYLNGVEVLRDNMPDGTPTLQTLALNRVEPPAYVRKTLSLDALAPGTNIIAAEVHQASPASPDLAFDLNLSGLRLVEATNLNLVYFSTPRDNDSFSSPTNLNLQAVAQNPLSAASKVEFFAEGEKLGEAASAPFSQVWSNPPTGPHTLLAVATFGSAVVTSAPVVVTIAPAAPAPLSALSLEFVPTNATWSYFCTNTGAPAEWQTPGFDDASWRRGVAKLGFAADTNGFGTVFYGGPGSARYPAAYFRCPFVAQDPASLTALNLSLQRDDGVLIYLNGVEILRDNMTNNSAVSYATLATNASDNGNAVLTFDLPTARLVVGSNLLAAEVHQYSLASPDLVFALGLKGVALTNRPRGIWLTAPADETVMQLPADVTLAAEAVAGGSLGLSKVEFFAGGAKIGEAGALPYSCVWTNPPGGAFDLTAVAQDTDGGSVTSAPVRLNLLPLPPGRALVSFGDVWKYLDDGSTPGTDWTAIGYDDRAWLSGPSKLGYGGSGEVTTVSFGNNPAGKPITTYFRRTFTMAEPAALDSLLLQSVLDAGGVVYLNGREVDRVNLPPFPISPDSLAWLALDDSARNTPINVRLPADALVAGTNVVAVEVHLADIASGDLGFDLALTGLAATSPADGIYLTSPADGAHFNLPASVPLATHAVQPGPVTLVEYYEGAARIGQADTAPYDFAWTNAAEGTHVLLARALSGTGLLMTSAPVTITVGRPPPRVSPVSDTLIPALADWKYWDNLLPVADGWQQPSFEDSDWPAGLARFGWGNDGERTLLTQGRITQYFRRWFQVIEPGLYAELLFQLALDDGAVVYLNGREVFRSNLRTGPVTPTTLALTSVVTPDETSYLQAALAASGSGLQSGSNLVAVELHQASANDSDGGFDLQLIGAGATGPRIYLSQPPDQSVYDLEATVTLVAQAWPGSNAMITRVEFLVDGQLLGEQQVAPYVFAWSNLPPSTHLLSARATDSEGQVLLSDPIQITGAFPGVTTLLVASNAVWNYLDDGSDQGTNWARLGFDDSGWSAGPAELGYGDAAEATVVSFGPNSSSKYITTYFRRAFVPVAGVTYTNLFFRLLRDDGAVVYLNGVEVYRSNMPTNAIDYLTHAVLNLTGSDETTYFATNLPTTGLLPGTNLLAVEIHQSSPTSADISFALEMSASGYLDNSVPQWLRASVQSGQIVLAWPADAQGYRLYTAPSLDGPSSAWTPVLTPPSVADGWKMVTLPADRGQQMFRLERP
jgi:hypothetical protein